MTTLDFAAARARLSSRHPQPPPPPPTNSTLLRLPPALRSLLAPLLTTPSTPPTFRVSQVDAELLDDELLSLLQSQVASGLKHYSAHLTDDWSAEITLLLRALLWKLTIWDHDATYGASLQGLRFVDARGPSGKKPSRTQKALYGLLSVGGRYAWGKWEDRLRDAEAGYEEPKAWTRWAATATEGLSTLHAGAALLSFAAFLVTGRYRALLDRFLRLRLAATSAHVSREVSFEYLNRQLVWHAFTEFLLFILPLVGVARWRRGVSRAWKAVLRFLARVRGAGEEEEHEQPGELGFLPERTCAICHLDQNPTGIEGGGGGVVGSGATDVTNPYMGECGCVYCFVCLAQRLDAEDGGAWTCLRCGRGVKTCRPWHGDVVTSEDLRGEEGEEEEEVKVVEPVPESDEREEEVEREIQRSVDGEEDEAEVGDEKLGADKASWVQAEDNTGGIEEEEDAEDPGASLVA